MNKKAFVEINGKRQWTCNYKNCRTILQEGLYCSSHFKKLQDKRQKDEYNYKMTKAIFG